MATLERAVASLRIIGDDLVPSELTKLLGVEPTLAYAKGDAVTSRSMNARVRRTGMWSLKAPETEPADLDRQVFTLLDSLPQDSDVWRRLSSRFEIDLFCGWFMGRGNEGTQLSAGALSALGARGIELNIDLYAGAND